MKVWITKYALTTGIQEAEGRIDATGRMFLATHLDGEEVKFAHAGYFHKHKKEWHLTREGAVRHAESMRSSKIASLRKAIRRLEALNFEQADVPVEAAPARRPEARARRSLQP